MAKFLNDTSLKHLIEKMQKAYGQSFTSHTGNSDIGKFTYTVYKDKTGGGIEAETKTIDTGANNVAVANGTTSGTIKVTTNGTAANITVKDAVTSIATGSTSGTISVGKEGGTGSDVAVKNVVTTDGNQSISGTKTFTGTVKVPDIASGATDTSLAANKKYVDDKIAAADAMVYKGTVYPSNDSASGHNHLPTSGVVVGDTYKAAGTTAGSTYATGVTANLGDLIIAQAVSGTTTQTITWDVIESGNDIVGVTAGDGLSGGGTSGTVTLSANIDTAAGLKFDSSSPKKIQVNIGSDLKFSSGAITHNVTGKTKALGFYKVQVDANGHVISTAAPTNTDIAGAGGITSITAGDGLTGGGSPTDGVVTISADVQSGNGLSIDSTSKKIKMSLGSSSATGAVKVSGGNGLSIDGNGNISLAVGSTSAFGAVKVTNGHGLSISNGVITMSNATTSADGAMSSTDKTNLNTLTTNPTNNTAGDYLVSFSSGNAVSLTQVTTVSTTDIDNMWAGTYSA